MSAGLIFIHGRGQQMPRALRGDKARVEAKIAGDRRGWLAGLAKGLTLAGRPPVAESSVYYPFYGNVLADLIEDHEARGLPRPDLELEQAAPARTRDQLILDAARDLGFDPATELEYTEPELAGRVRRSARSPEEEIDLSGVLRVPIVASALQFLARKTGTAEWVIEGFLTDVAYYLEIATIRDRVLDVVQETMVTAIAEHDTVVVVGHSLGSIVAYDVLQDAGTPRPVSLLVTAGSPIGFPIVQRNLLGRQGGDRPRVPVIDAPANPRWINAYDVRDVVALIHPIHDQFDGGPAAIRDVVTHNPNGPHSIGDYLSDQDVAAPIAAAIAAR
ncbi:alpha/beta fold hydrolase [Actinoplanes sp. NPDC024001]|uniref:alpha/beta fold hydrolase n=1 Tax=Actinoplanes sp. NPDC024001 TaxID=3154598 RepID=UPI0033D664B7